MPGTPTPNYAWPIPALTDPADAPANFHVLAVQMTPTSAAG